MSEIEDLKRMLSHFRVNDLQQLLMYAGRSKYGKKAELLDRALTLLTDCPAPMKIKIKELYKKVINTTYGLQQYRKIVMPSGAVGEEYPPGPPYNPHPQYSMGGESPGPPSFVYGAGGGRNQQQQHAAYLHNVLQHHMPNTPGGPGPSIHGRAAPLKMSAPPPAASLPIQPDVRFKGLPFYERLRELVKPTTLVPVTVDKNVPQENFFIFHLSPQMVNDIIGSKFVCPATGKVDYTTQIQLRICGYDINNEQEDNFPSNISVKVNGASTPLPLPLPPKAPSLEPKRPGRPLNITPLCKLSSLLENQINISWTNSSCNVYMAHVMAVFLVKKISTNSLLQRLRTKGIRDSDVTKALIKEKLKSGTDDLEIATTSLRISLICPLSKCPMVYACRASTCKHFQCFDANTFLLMNEKNPKWMCPVCHQPALYSNLMIDGLFMEILNSSPASTEIEFFQDASWTAVVLDGPSGSASSGLPSQPKLSKSKGQGTSSSSMTEALDSDQNDSAVVLQVISDHKSSSDEVRSLIRSDLEDYEEEEDEQEQPIKIASSAGHRSILANPSYLCSSPSVSSSAHSDDESRDIPRDSEPVRPASLSGDVDVIDLCSSPEPELPAVGDQSLDYLADTLNNTEVPSGGHFSLDDQSAGDLPAPPSTVTLKSTSLFYDFTDITMDDDETDPPGQSSPVTDYSPPFKKSRGEDSFRSGDDFFERGGETMIEKSHMTFAPSFPALPSMSQNVMEHCAVVTNSDFQQSASFDSSEIGENNGTSTFFIHQRPYLAPPSPNLTAPPHSPFKNSPSFDLSRALLKYTSVVPWDQASTTPENTDILPSASSAEVAASVPEITLQSCLEDEATSTTSSETLAFPVIDAELARSVADCVSVTQHRVVVDNIFEPGGPLVNYPKSDQKNAPNLSVVTPQTETPCMIKSPEIEAADREIARNIFTLMQNDIGTAVPEQKSPAAAGSKIDAVCAEMLLKRSTAQAMQTQERQNLSAPHQTGPPSGSNIHRALYRKKSVQQNQVPPPLKLITQAQPITTPISSLLNVTYVSNPGLSYNKTATTSNPFRWTSGPYRAAPTPQQQQNFRQGENYGRPNYFNQPAPNPMYPYPPNNQQLRYYSPPPMIPSPNSSFFAPFFPQQQQHFRPSGPTLYRDRSGGPSGSSSSDPTSKIQAIVDNVFERIQTTKKPYS